MSACVISALGEVMPMLLTQILCFPCFVFSSHCRMLSEFRFSGSDKMKGALQLQMVIELKETG